jgi:hypothetical protein
MAKKKILNYFNRVLIALDVLFNVVLGGDINQTYSARSWLLKKQGKPNLVWLIDRVFFWDPSHCMSSYIVWLTGKNIRKIGRKGIYNARNTQYNIITDDKKEIYDENFD